MKEKTCNPQILGLLAGKSSTKQLVYRQCKELFKEFKKQLALIAGELNSNICNIDKQVVVSYKDKGDFEAHIHFSGDTIVFQLHSNVFTLEKSHSIWKHSYIKEDNMRAYFGMIHMYNFLSDSFKYNRQADYGHLMGRIFINKDKHFFTEGEREFGFLFNDLEEQSFSANEMRQIIEKSMVYALDFDLTAPNFRDMREITVSQITKLGSDLSLSTRKKLGFKLSYEREPIK